MSDESSTKPSYEQLEFRVLQLQRDLIATQIHLMEAVVDGINMKHPAAVQELGKLDMVLASLNKEAAPSGKPFTPGPLGHNTKE